MTWSNLYAYYNIRSDRNYSSFRSSKEIIHIFESTGMLHQKFPMIFSNASSFPWIEIFIAQTTNGNFGVSKNSNYEFVNLISVVASKQNDQDRYIALLTTIAEKLNWEVIEDEHGSENVVIYPC